MSLVHVIQRESRGGKKGKGGRTLFRLGRDGTQVELGPVRHEAQGEVLMPVRDDRDLCRSVVRLVLVLDFERVRRPSDEELLLADALLGQVPGELCTRDITQAG